MRTTRSLSAAIALLTVIGLTSCGILGSSSVKTNANAGNRQQLLDDLNELNNKLTRAITQVDRPFSTDFASGRDQLGRTLTDLEATKLRAVDQFPEVFGLPYPETFTRLSCIDERIQIARAFLDALAHGYMSTGPGTYYAHKRIRNQFANAKECKDTLEKALTNADLVPLSASDDLHELNNKLTRAITQVDRPFSTDFASSRDQLGRTLTDLEATKLRAVDQFPEVFGLPYPETFTRLSCIDERIQIARAFLDALAHGYMSTGPGTYYAHKRIRNQFANAKECKDTLEVLLPATPQTAAPTPTTTATPTPSVGCKPASTASGTAVLAAGVQVPASMVGGQNLAQPPPSKSEADLASMGLSRSITTEFGNDNVQSTTSQFVFKAGVDPNNLDAAASGSDAFQWQVFTFDNHADACRAENALVGNLPPVKQEVTKSDLAKGDVRSFAFPEQGTPLTGHFLYWVFDNALLSVTDTGKFPVSQIESDQVQLFKGLKDQLTSAPAFNGPIKTQTDAAQTYESIVAPINTTQLAFGTKAHDWNTSTTNDQALTQAQPLVAAIGNVSTHLIELATTYPRAAPQLLGTLNAVVALDNDLSQLSALDSIGVPAWSQQYNADVDKLIAASNAARVALGLSQIGGQPGVGGLSHSTGQNTSSGSATTPEQPGNSSVVVAPGSDNSTTHQGKSSTESCTSSQSGSNTTSQCNSTTPTP